MLGPGGCDEIWYTICSHAWLVSHKAKMKLERLVGVRRVVPFSTYSISNVYTYLLCSSSLVVVRSSVQYCTVYHTVLY